MTQKQARKASPSSRAPARQAPQSSPPQGRSRSASTSIDDPTFNLVSVLYHAMQGVDTSERYIRDARESDQAELVSFFEETRAAYQERATRAKTLLGSMLGETTSENEDENEDEDEED